MAKAVITTDEEEEAVREFYLSAQMDENGYMYFYNDDFSQQRIYDKFALITKIGVVPLVIFYLYRVFSTQLSGLPMWIDIIDKAMSYSVWLVVTSALISVAMEHRRSIKKRYVTDYELETLHKLYVERHIAQERERTRRHNLKTKGLRKSVSR
jgi:hypothetical protein